MELPQGLVVIEDPRKSAPPEVVAQHAKVVLLDMWRRARRYDGPTVVIVANPPLDAPARAT